MSDREVATGLVLDIQRMSTEDGPGIRTTVFMKGCTLLCAWCHNPESIAPRQEVIWHDQLCMGCRLCLEACPHQARQLDAGGVEIDRDRCQVCGACVSQCPTTAAARIGSEYGVDDLVNELLKDRAFFDSSGGGVTVSGGEPAMQSHFVAALLTSCRAAGVHTALDTCGMCSTERLLAAASHADLVLYDLKLMDSEKHRALTGQPNQQILANLLRLREQIQATQSPPVLWVRTPLIPGATTHPENIRAIGDFLASHFGEVLERWELCAFNNLGAHKYGRLGRTWAFGDTPLLSEEELMQVETMALGCGIAPQRVVATGATRLEMEKRA